MHHRHAFDFSVRMNMDASRFLQLIAVALACLAFGSSAESQQCAVGLTTPGRTWPAGDIVLEHGNSLRLYCILNMTYVEHYFPGKGSRDLVFFKGQRQMDPEYITILNETTIQLDVNKPPPENAMYYCKLRLDTTSKKDYEAVCLNKVVVGFKPEAPKNVRCLSQNWENLTCTWELPQNYIDTSYAIAYRLMGRAGSRMLHQCPTDRALPPGKERPRDSCFWAFDTNPLYRQAHENYTLLMHGGNVLGNWTGSYLFQHYAHVIPAKPINLTVADKTYNSAILQWKIAFPMEDFPPGMHLRVSYQSHWDSRDKWKTINITDKVVVKEGSYNLSGLTYANTIYDVRVALKSAYAVGEDMWSNFSYVTFRTLQTLPGQSPRTDIGSFEVEENNLNRDIYLYWQAIPEQLENGRTFRYRFAIIMENKIHKYVRAEDYAATTHIYAKFEGLAHDIDYTFSIMTSNEFGIRKESAKIFVPSKSSKPKEPEAFTKIAFEDGLYELSWKAPAIGSANIKNYTIFWCENERDRPYQCEGYLEWVHVPKTTFIHNVTVPDPHKVYQFAISANTEHASSGMVWASCTVIHNKAVSKMNSVWINRVDSTTIEVGWKLDCSDRIGIIEGFKIYYCPIVSPYDVNCKGPKLNTTIKTDYSGIRGKVTGLKPYTTYMIAVAVLNKNGEGQHSEPLLGTTLELKPSDPPHDVVISNVTNTTMHIEWRGPLAMNGVLRYYIVYYDHLEMKVDKVPRVDLTGLRAHHNYSIRVAACTVQCSDKSQPVYAMTDIGVPNAPLPPTVRFLNSSEVRVFWNEPLFPSGPLDYYQVKDNDIVMNITNTEAIISIPDCNTVGREKMYKFFVRAVNIAPNNEHLFGNWSEAGEGNCFSAGPSYAIWILIWIIGSISGIGFIFCLAYSSKRIWLKCKEMRDIEIEIPPGLTSNTALLKKKEQHTRQSSADSSGCSSGQESANSCLTSDSQISNDSGTEVDPIAPKELMIDAAVDSSTTTTTTTGSSPAVWESSSLRQRNVIGATKPTSLDATRWADPYVKIANSSTEPIGTNEPADSLSLARSTPNLNENMSFGNSQQMWTSTGYLNMLSTEQLPTDPSTKENPNPGSYSVVGTMSKSPLRGMSEKESASPVKTKTNESSVKPTSNPYVSLASLEQKTKDSGAPKTLDSMRVLNELGFNTPKPFDKPYVQHGFRDFPKSTLPYDSTHQRSSLTISAQQQQQPSFFAQTSLAEDLTNKLIAPVLMESKPYVALSEIPEMLTRNPDVPMPSTSTTTTHKPYVAISQLPTLPRTTIMMSTERGSEKENETKPSVDSTAFQILPDSNTPSITNCDADESQQTNGFCYPSTDIEVKDGLSLDGLLSNSPTPSLEYDWDSSPEISPSHSPAELQQQTQPQFQKSSTGYVKMPEQQILPGARFVKLPPTSIQKQQEHQSTTDEQSYSKVAVVPHVQ
ncbi:cytokine receptor [Copidosoma floridanum]|uniref:cytokine receptor n=1 Tax=Copidosoma floridanum TaxID=29053 RepID=UPI0006C99E73|nr:cytokine receptor [Copidosoma floridanum]